MGETGGARKRDFIFTLFPIICLSISLQACTNTAIEKNTFETDLSSLPRGSERGGVSCDCAVLKLGSYLERSKEDQCLYHSCLLGIVANNLKKRGVGGGKRGGRRGGEQSQGQVFCNAAMGE